MINLAATPAEQDKITAYLATHFPPNTKRAPKLIAGDAQITFKSGRFRHWANARVIRSRRPMGAFGG